MSYDTILTNRVLDPCFEAPEWNGRHQSEGGEAADGEWWRAPEAHEAPFRGRKQPFESKMTILYTVYIYMINGDKRISYDICVLYITTSHIQYMIYIYIHIRFFLCHCLPHIYIYDLAPIYIYI